MRTVLTILAYLTAAVPATAWCVSHSASHGVESTFTRKGLSSLFADLGLAPLTVFFVVPFAIAFWPLLCLMDLSEIPKKKRLQRKLRDSTETANAEAALTIRNLEKYKLQAGNQGLTLGVLSPMGQVVIDDVVWDARSSSQYIANNRKVVVIGHRGSTLVVEPVGDA